MEQWSETPPPRADWRQRAAIPAHWVDAPGEDHPTVRCAPMGPLPDGRPVQVWTLRCPVTRQTLEVLSFGGIVRRCWVADRAGGWDNIVIGFEDLQSWWHLPHFSSLVGRYANRIAGARFSLEGTEYTLEDSQAGNALHGGSHGLGRQVWQVAAAPPDEGTAIRLYCHSPHGSGGYPGDLDVTVEYRWLEDGTWQIDYHAVTSQPTVINLTHHAYFNLAGSGDRTRSDQPDVRGHWLQIHGDTLLAAGPSLLPEGVMPVADTPFDLRAARRLGAVLGQSHPQLQRARGFDHNWILTGAPLPADLPLGGAWSLPEVARLTDPRSGRRLTVSTSEPGVQCFTANFAGGALAIPGARPLPAHAGVCLETQHFPDSPNHPGYPTTVLRPGAVWRSRTALRFDRI